ncbi:MAG TPA: acyloxyacyl hydrolase [Stellaceae bacterium]|nr:acyloxyacyl hydrolase [Stellaceae bacterium]
MRGKFGRLALAAGTVLCLALAGGGANAESGISVAAGLGAFDFLHNYTAGEGRLELRFNQSFFFLKPLVGVFVTTKGSVYTYGGFRAELAIGKHFMIIPVATVGDYEKGDGKDLGSHVEFKTGAEFDYVMDNGIKFGPAFDHVSNAGIGKKNPGEENLMLMVTVPFGLIAGN